MYYQNVSVGQLIKRVSRFTVEIDLNGTVEPVHMNNTGRNKEILIPGSLASVRPMLITQIAKRTMTCWLFNGKVAGSTSTVWRPIMLPKNV